MYISTEQAFGPESIGGYPIRAIRYEDRAGRVAWHVVAPSNPFGDEYWLEGDKLFRAVVNRMQNGSISVRPKTPSLGLPAPHEQAIRTAVEHWQLQL